MAISKHLVTSLLKWHVAAHQVLYASKSVRTCQILLAGALMSIEVLTFMTCEEG